MLSLESLSLFSRESDDIENQIDANDNNDIDGLAESTIEIAEASETAESAFLFI